MKRCPKCSLTKPVSDFYRKAKSKDGLQGYCKKCTNQASARSAEKAAGSRQIQAKTCPACQVTKHASAFWKNSKTRDGLQIYCKPCAEFKTRATVKDETKVRISIKAREKRLQNYGLSIASYNLLLAGQGHCCAICKAPPVDDHGRHLAVDHCADTGRVRGLLCARCNQGIGKFDHNADFLRAAADYCAASV